jgi:hypothetical protein
MTGTLHTLTDAERDDIAWMYWKTKHRITRQAYEEMPRAHVTAERDSWKKTQAMAAKLSGLKPVLFDCCEDSCCAFTGPKAKLTQCPYCKKARFHPDSGKPVKRFSYVPLIPRLHQEISRSTDH